MSSSHQQGAFHWLLNLISFWRYNHLTLKFNLHQSCFGWKNTNFWHNFCAKFFYFLIWRWKMYFFGLQFHGVPNFFSSCHCSCSLPERTQVRVTGRSFQVFFSNGLYFQGIFFSLNSTPKRVMLKNGMDSITTKKLEWICEKVYRAFHLIFLGIFFYLPFLLPCQRTFALMLLKKWGLGRNIHQKKSCRSTLRGKRERALTNFFFFAPFLLNKLRIFQVILKLCSLNTIPKFFFGWEYNDQ